MTDSISGGVLSCKSIFFILKYVPFRIDGTWHISDAHNEDQDSHRVNSCLDYLVNVNGINNVIHPDDISGIRSTLDSDRASGEMKWSFRIITPSGQVRHMLGTGKLVGEQRQRVAHTDTSDETKSIIASKNLLEAVFNTSTLGLHVLKSVRNKEGRIIDFDVVKTNATSDRIAGKKVEGMRMLESWPHTREIGLFDKFIETVQTGRPFTFEHAYEGDGVKAWFEWMASRLFDGLYVTIEDITKRKNDEQSLKRTADRLQSTFDGVPAIIALLEVVTDAGEHPTDFVISAANQSLSDFTGCSTRDLIGKRMTDLYPEAFRGQLRDGYLRVFLTGEPMHMEFLYPGVDRWFSIFVTKQVDGHGIVTVALEITAQKKGEEQRKQNELLAELDRAKTEFFSNVSHEFRTPLTLMLAPLNDILRKFGEKKSYAEHIPAIEMVKRNALRLQKLVNSLLDFSSIEAGRTETIFQPTDLAEFTTLLAGNFRSAIESAGIAFKVKCESMEPVYVNQDMWEKIVLNLVSNAFKFTFKGTIEVVLRSYKKQVQLHVRDTGIGIAHADVSKIFQRFIRIQNAKCRTNEGTGIGLALVKELVNIHGGNIRVKSKEGEGTQFIISIPKGKAHLSPRNVHELKDKVAVSPLSAIYGYEAMNWLPGNIDDITSIQRTSGPGNCSAQHFTPAHREMILLVDDNSDIREYIKSILSSHYSVATAHHGKGALELIARGLKPALILTDIRMPEMDGYSLLDAINGDARLKGTPVIFLSAQASEQDRIKGMESGADDYLVKPFSSAELLSRVDARMRKRVV